MSHTSMEIIAFAEKCSHLVAELASCDRKYRNGDVSEAGFLQESVMRSQVAPAEIPAFINL